MMVRDAAAGAGGISTTSTAVASAAHAMFESDASFCARICRRVRHDSGLRAPSMQNNHTCRVQLLQNRKPLSQMRGSGRFDTIILTYARSSLQHGILPTSTADGRERTVHHVGRGVVREGGR